MNHFYLSFFKVYQFVSASLWQKMNFWARMNNSCRGLATLGAILLLSGCSSIDLDSTTPATNSATLYQVSTIDALLTGVYDGSVSLGELEKHGDFGIGTFDRLDGEMVLLDGEMYQVKSDGKIYRPAPSLTTPFAAVCYFDANSSFDVKSGLDFAGIQELIDAKAPNQNLFTAIKITGKFKMMKTRSVPGQHKPYPPLTEVTKNQPEFEMKNISGTIIGFRCPAYVKGLNVTGYHLHFISDDRTKGGHVLSFEIDEAKGEIDMFHKFTLQLPENNDEFGKADLTKDRTEELHKVEK